MNELLLARPLPRCPRVRPFGRRAGSRGAGAAHGRLPRVAGSRLDDSRGKAPRSLALRPHQIAIELLGDALDPTSTLSKIIMEIIQPKLSAALVLLAIGSCVRSGRTPSVCAGELRCLAMASRATNVTVGSK
jgi:hypothetical protein